MLIILKGRSVTAPVLFNPLQWTHFQMLCGNSMWKWLGNGCAVLHPSKLCLLFLTEKGAWPGLHLGKSFPPHNGQRQTSSVPVGLFLKSFLWDWKTFFNSGNQAHSPTMKSSFERGSELTINFISAPSSPRFSYISGTKRGPLLSWKTLPPCDLLSHSTKPFRSKGKSGEVLSCSPDLQRIASTQQSQHPLTAEPWHFANIISVDPRNSPEGQVVFSPSSFIEIYLTSSPV